MAKKALKKKSLPPARPRRDYGLSSGDFLPRINTNCKDGIATVRDGKNTVELTLPVRLECDLEAVEVRLRKFENNQMVDGGLYEGGKVVDDFKVTIIAPMFGVEPLKELGGVALGLRSYETSAYSAREAFDEIEAHVYTAKRGPDQVPVVELEGFEAVSYGNRHSKRPLWKIVDWKPRRTEFKNYAVEHGIGVTYDTDEDPNDELPELAGDVIPQ